MRILFISSTLPEYAETQVKYISNAANRFCINVIKSLINCGHQVSIVSYIGYPVEAEFISDFNGGIVEDEKFFFKSADGINSILNFRKYCFKRLNEVDIVISYNSVYAWFGIAKRASVLKKKSIMLLADYSDSSCFTDYLHKIMALFQKRDFRTYDRVIGLSRNVKKYLSQDQEFECVEGGIDQGKWINIFPPDKSERITIMYSGLLSEVTGIDMAIAAIKQIENENIRFVITGSGVLEEHVKVAQETDDRISFLGRLEYDEYVALLGKANILINPRNMTFNENANNFPSKILEYFATGRVIISTKFAGWDCFSDNAIFVESNVSSIREGIENALKNYNDICDEVYLKNKKLAEKYDWKHQIKTILGER